MIPRTTACVDCGEPTIKGRARCREHYNARRKGRSHGEPPPCDVLPPGFEVRQVASKVTPDGKLDQQWIGTRRQGDRYEEIQTAIPTGHKLSGVSTLVDEDGNVRAQWIKTSLLPNEAIQWAMDAMAKIADRFKGKARPAVAPKPASDDLLVVLPMGDPHFGMLSWAPETGHNFDLEIAESNLRNAVDNLIAIAPRAKRCLIINVGDFFHHDGKGNTTTAGTPVDVDGRTPKVFAVGVRSMRYEIDKALRKFEIVDVIVEIGNHDALLSLMLAQCLAQFYEREPRVRIDTSPMNVHKYRFGKNLICTTHGDRLKMEHLGEIMAADYPQDWAETTHRLWVTGHVHHQVTKELRGCTVRSFRTLAPADDWHRKQGYRCGRDMRALVFHREHGLVNEHTVGISMLEAA